MDFSFQDKFCKHFAAIKQCFEVFVNFNIDQCLLNRTDKISISLFYNEKLDVEKEKIQLDQFARKCKLGECGWQVTCEMTTKNSDFRYGIMLFNRNFTYTTCFEFRRPTDKINLYCDITVDE